MLALALALASAQRGDEFTLVMLTAETCIKYNEHTAGLMTYTRNGGYECPRWTFTLSPFEDTYYSICDAAGMCLLENGLVTEVDRLDDKIYAWRLCEDGTIAARPRVKKCLRASGSAVHVANDDTECTEFQHPRRRRHTDEDDEFAAYAGVTSTTSTNQPDIDDDTEDADDGLSDGAIAGIAVGAVAVVGLGGVAIAMNVGRL